jgi:hypothetical protein
MDKETLENLYKELGSINAVARALNKPISTVRWHIVKHGIEINTTGYKSPKTKRHYAVEHHNWKGGKHLSDGYIREYAPSHPHNAKGYVLQHRLVMEHHLGRYLEPHEIVHHINGDKLDNRIENLVITNRSTHIKGHKATEPRDSKGRFA